jgi:predicted peptidase
MVAVLLCVVGCNKNETVKENSSNDNKPIMKDENSNDYMEIGKTKSKGFVIDNVLHSEIQGDIHFTSFYPNNYNENEEYAIYFALPGWEGLYFQGVGSNMYESLPFEAQKYNEKMIIISPQLDDWGEESANDTIFLVEYFLNYYNIDKSKVYISGLSGGGETLSLVLEKRPELFTSALHVSSKWDGKYNKLIEAKTPLYMVIGENDSYYGSAKTKNAYNDMYKLYKQSGLSDEEIDKILVIDIKPHEYFTSKGYSDEHAGCNLFAYEEDIMNWVFKKIK